MQEYSLVYMNYEDFRCADVSFTFRLIAMFTSGHEQVKSHLCIRMMPLVNSNEAASRIENTDLS